MALTNDIISQFAKLTTNNNEKPKETTVYGTVVISDGKKYVRLDGSNMDTPISSTTKVANGDRVTVMIKNHEAIVTGNISSPSVGQNEMDATDEKVNNLSSQVSEFGIIVSCKVSTEELDVINATIESMKAITGKFTELDAVTAEIETLQAKFAELEYIDAKDIEAINAEINNISAQFGEFTDLTVEDMEAFNVEITNLTSHVGKFTYVSAEVLEAMRAGIETLESEKITTEDLDARYANIDFSNINQMAAVKVFAESGIINDLTVNDSTITGELVGVTIKGDLIEAGTLKADKLVVKGSDGLFYKLNFEYGNFESAEEVPDEGLHGDVIIANSITAEKIAVEDLVAFGAKIGGFNIEANSIYSDVKNAATNTTRGVYLDTYGQFSLGDSVNFLRYYKDENENYKLEIAAESLVFSTTGKSVESLMPISEHVHIGKYTNPTTGEEQPCIELYKDPDDNALTPDFKVIITNNSAVFYTNEEAETIIDNTGIITNNLSVDETIQHGTFTWVLHGSNGNLGLLINGGGS